MIRVGVFTSGRQDWWILEPVARAIAGHESLELSVFMSGTHLLDEFGGTAAAVRGAGFETIEVAMGDTGSSGGSGMAAGDLARMAVNLVDAMHRRPVDVMVVLGDRIETLMAAVTVAADQRFVAHIHGGDRAPGEFDDGARHAITKLAHVHFPATVESAERIRRLGEPSWRVFCVGSPSIDGVMAGGMAEWDEARAAAGMEVEGAFALILQHPSGLGEEGERRAAEAIGQGVAEAGLRAVCIGPNADPGRDTIWKTWQDFSCRFGWPIRITVDRRVFLRLMREAVALVGNSSSGMVESAAAGAAVVNVGSRQSGREHSANVLDVAAERGAIAEALTKLQNDSRLAEELRAAKCVFGDGQASARIAETLAKTTWTREFRIKLNEY